MDLSFGDPRSGDYFDRHAVWVGFALLLRVGEVEAFLLELLESRVLTPRACPKIYDKYGEEGLKGEVPTEGGGGMPGGHGRVYLRESLFGGRAFLRLGILQF